MTVQQRLCNNKWFRLAVSVILTLAVVTVFVCAPFAQAHAIVGVDDALIVIMIAGLAAAGITFTSTGAFDNLVDYVGGLIEEYATDEGTTAIGLFSDVQYSNNKVGQLLLNNRFVRLISAFATWVKVKLDLVNDDTQSIVEAGSSLDGRAVYVFPVEFRYGQLTLYYTTSVSPVYFARTTVNTNTIYFDAFSENNFVLHKITYNSSGVISSTSDTSATYHDDYSVYKYTTSGFQGPSSVANAASWEIFGTHSEWQSYMRGTDVVETNNVAIGVNTGVITPPLDDEDYEDGDGALVDVGTTWGGTLKDILDKIRARWQTVQTGEQEVNMEFAGEGEIEAQLPEQTDIENLPGGTAWNPTDQQLKFFEFESIWHYVAQWIQDFTAGASVVWNAAIQLPSPVVNMVYAMVTLSIIFGVIKVMRA